MFDTPTMQVSTRSMNRLRLFDLGSTKISTLDATPLRSLVEIDIRHTPITSLDLRSNLMLMEVSGCIYRRVLTVPGVTRDD